MGLKSIIIDFSICSIFLVYYIFVYESYGLSIQFYLLLKEMESGKARTSRESHRIQWGAPLQFHSQSLQNFVNKKDGMVLQ